jgi:hypothetical protein
MDVMLNEKRLLTGMLLLLDMNLIKSRLMVDRKLLMAYYVIYKYF